MSARDAKAQRIHADSVKRTNRRRISFAATSKPTENAVEHFRRKPYGKSEKPNKNSEEKRNEQYRTSSDA